MANGYCGQLDCSLAMCSLRQLTLDLFVHLTHHGGWLGKEFKDAPADWVKMLRRAKLE